jgi:hypothetical protein
VNLLFLGVIFILYPRSSSLWFLEVIIYNYIIHLIFYHGSLYQHLLLYSFVFLSHKIVVFHAGLEGEL